MDSIVPATLSRTTTPSTATPTLTAKHAEVVEPWPRLARTVNNNSSNSRECPNFPPHLDFLHLPVCCHPSLAQRPTCRHANATTTGQLLRGATDDEGRNTKAALLVGIKLDLEAEVHLTARVRGDICIGLY